MSIDIRHTPSRDSEARLKDSLPALFHAEQPDDTHKVPDSPSEDLARETDLEVLIDAYAAHVATKSRLLLPAIGGELPRPFLFPTALQAEIQAAIADFGHMTESYTSPQEQSFGQALIEFYASAPIRSLLAKYYEKETVEQFINGLKAHLGRTPDQPIGLIDEVSNMLIRGFVVHPAKPQASVTLGIYLNDCFVGRAQTSILRQDLMQRYGGNGYFGFEFEIKPAPDQTRHQFAYVDVRILDTQEPIASRKIRLGHVRDETVYLARATIALERVMTSLERHRFLGRKRANMLSKRIKHLTGLMPRVKRTIASPTSGYRLLQESLHPNDKATPKPSTGAPKVTILAGLTHAVRRAQTGGHAYFLRCNPKDMSPAAVLKTAHGMADEDLVILTSRRDQLVPSGLAHLRAEAADNPDQDAFVLDFLTDDTPGLHGAFDPHLLLAHNPYRHAIAFRKRALTRLVNTPTPQGTADIKAGERLAGVGVWLLALADAQAQIGQVHYPVMDLVHEGPKGAKGRFDAHLDAMRAYHAHDASTNITAWQDIFAGGSSLTVRARTAPQDPRAKISIIIPTRNALDITKDCIDSLKRTITASDDYEILLMNNQSDEPAMLAWLQELATQPNVRVIDYDDVFNWSAINNVAAKHATGSILLFLNNDTIALERGWDDILREKMRHDDIGAVGARLLFEDGTIQHAGVILYDVGVATHEGVGETCAEGGYQRRTQSDHACSAVTGAFLACRADLFDQLGGFNATDLTVTFNDIDFCLRVRETGKTVLYTPHITFTHLESKTRGYDYADAKKRERAQAERLWMEDRWQDALGQDPYYPPAMARRGRPFTLLKGVDYDAG